MAINVAHYRTVNNFHGSGDTPFSSYSPRSTNSIPEPATESLTVADTRTSPAPAEAQTRAAIWTATPARSSLRITHSPVGKPTLRSRPRFWVDLMIVWPQRMALDLCASAHSALRHIHRGSGQFFTVMLTPELKFEPLVLVASETST